MGDPPSPTSFLGLKEIIVFFEWQIVKNWTIILENKVKLCFFLFEKGIQRVNQSYQALPNLNLLLIFSIAQLKYFLRLIQ